MEVIWLTALVALWLVVLIQGFFILFLYRQVGIHLLNRAEAVSRDGLRVGSGAPDLELRDAVSGRMSTLSRLRDRLQLVVFGGPRCSACASLIPDLTQYAVAQSRVQVVFVSDAGISQTREYAETHGFERIHVLADPERQLFAKFRARVMPFGFVVDEDGIVRSKGLLNHMDHIHMLLTKAGRDGVIATENRPSAVAGGPVLVDS